MLTWANMVGGWWTSAAVMAIQRQQRTALRAALKAMQPKPTRKRRRR